MKLLLIGPLPPPIGGASISFRKLEQQLRNRNNFDLKVINTSSIESLMPFINYFMVIINSIVLPVKIFNTDIVSFHASVNRFYIYGTYIKLLCKLFRKPFQARVFGSSIVDVYLGSNKIKKFLLTYVLKADQTLLQTKGLLNFFNSELPGHLKLKWFPTSRSTVYSLNKKVINPGIIRFVYIGHIRVEKGIKFLLDAVKIIHDNGLSLNLDIYGAVYNNVDPDLFDNIPNITYKGEVKNDEIIDIISNYDMMVFPTFYEGEGYPGAIIESLLAGTPVITTEWKYIPEVVQDGYNGYLVPVKDSQALALTMMKVINDPEILIDLSVNAQLSGKLFDSSKWNGEIFESWIKELVEK